MATPRVPSFLVACFVVACADDAPPVTPGAVDSPIIYGADDRLDLYQVTDPVLRRVADSTAILLPKSLVTPSGAGFAIHAFAYGSYGQYFKLCTSERFWSQPTPGNCSGFLVGPDLLATAGHCIDDTTCATTSIVFNYAMRVDATTYPTSAPASDVYGCQSILGRVETSALDYAIVKLDRPVTGGTMGRAPLPIRRDADGPAESDTRIAGMISLSYPSGIPLKIKGGPEPIPNRQVGGVKIKASYTNWFEVGADVAAGSSGSVIVSFDQAGDLLFAEADLVRGNPDFVRSGSCYVTAVCGYDAGCSGKKGSGWEEYNRSTTWDHLVPQLDACALDPDGCSFVVSQPGEACWRSGDTRDGGVLDFGCGPAVAPRGSLHLQTREGFNSDKATLDRRAWTPGDGCDGSPIGDALVDVQSLSYSWHVKNDGTFTYAAPALKLLIDTNESNGTSAARLETIGDKILVYEPYLQIGAMMVEDTWITETVTRTAGRWWLVDLTPGGSPSLGVVSRSDLRTLAQWTTALAAAGAPKIASVQLGVGSGNPGVDSWVDALEYASTLASFDVEFAAPSGCAATGGSSGEAVLGATASFLERGVAKTTADAWIRVAPSDVVGLTITEKDDALATLGERIRLAVAQANARPPASRAKYLAVRIAELRRLADADVGGDPNNDLLVGPAALAYRTMLARALE